VRSFSVSAALFGLLSVSRPAEATEPLPPELTRETAVGEWAGVAEDNVGQSYIIYLQVPARGAPTLAFVHAPDLAFLFSLTSFDTAKGRLSSNGSGIKWAGSQGGAISMEGYGRSFGDMGWIRAKISRGDLVFETRFVKTPERFFRHLQKLLRSGRSAVSRRAQSK
jgi:hypothetical protein